MAFAMLIIFPLSWSLTLEIGCKVTTNFLYISDEFCAKIDEFGAFFIGVCLLCNICAKLDEICAFLA